KITVTRRDSGVIVIGWSGPGSFMVLFMWYTSEKLIEEARRVMYLPRQTSSLVVQFRDAAATICIRGLEARTLLPALPVSIQELETLVQRRRIHRELRERDRGRQRDVGESRLVAPQQPFASVRKMFVDQCSMGQGFFT